MDPNEMPEPMNSCVLHETTTVVIDEAAKMRRRKMEIRRSKKLSYQGLNVSQRNGCKRNRSLIANGVRNACSCDRKDGAKIKVSNADEISIDSESIFLLKDASASHDSGLHTSSPRKDLRSRSLHPAKAPHKDDCLLHSSEGKFLRDDTEDMENSFITVVNDELQKRSEAMMSCHNGMESCMEGTFSADMHYKNKESDEEPTTSVQNELTLERKISLSQSSMQSCIDMNMRERIQDEKMDPGPQLDEDASHLTGNMTVTQEGSVSVNGDESYCSDLEKKKLCPRRCPPSGKLLLCGRRREMEDSAVIVPCFAQLCSVVEAEDSSAEIVPCDLHFFAVYDGHGGSQASNYCATRLHHVLTEELATISTTKDGIEDFVWKKVMSSCFLKMDKEVGGICPNGTCDDLDSIATCCAGTIAPENVGTTALVAVVSATQIVIANCGDSRAVLCRGAKVIPLSTDHKPNRDDETSRIEAAGGRVIYWDGYRVGGLLAVSRAIAANSIQVVCAHAGDRYLKRYVVSEPDVLCLQRTEEDECLIMASDGLWDVVSNETACDVARRYLASAQKKKEHLDSVAALLVKLAYSRGSKDNITVLVVDLKSRSK